MTDFKYVLKPSKKVASPLMAYFCAVTYVLFVVCGFFTIFWDISFVMVEVTILAVDIYLSVVYAWRKEGVLYTKNCNVYYDLEDVVSLMGHTTTRHRIQHIDTLRLKNGNCYLEGNFEVAEPLSKYVPKSHITVYDISVDAYEELKKLLDK